MKTKMLIMLAVLCAMFIVCVPSAQATLILDLNDAIDHANTHAQPNSTGYCAMYVVDAIEAGGLEIQRNHAYLLDSSLLSAGFYESPEISKSDWSGYTPRVGDVVIWDATAEHPYGHIQIYTGSVWVSDFTQNTPFPWGNESTFHVYRYEDVNYQDEHQYWLYEDPDYAVPSEDPWTPEPATALLLGLGGLGLLRKRRMRGRKIICTR